VTLAEQAHKLQLSTDGPQQTGQLGARLGSLLLSGDLLCLEGNLGAGKTCLTQGIGRGLGLEMPITSPTFIIVNEYRLLNRRYKLYHIDLYRVQSTAEARVTGLDDYIYGNGICVIEWAERVRELLPQDRLWITMRYLAATRRALSFEAQGVRSQALLDQLRSELGEQELASGH
jgi:tRNA threonylcarbamoyladenosine biosynthesis protein TsaE